VIVVCERYPFTLSTINSKVPPERNGVYAFWSGRYCVYVGKTEVQTLRKRLCDHWSETHNPRLRKWIAVKKARLMISVHAIDDAKSISTYEKYYIKKFQPLTNVIMYK